MTRTLGRLLCILALGALSACGGGSSGGGSLPAALSMSDYASAYASIATDPNLASMTPQATVDARGGSASYAGYATMTVGDGMAAAGYYGGVAMTADFAANSVTGNAGNFVKFFSAVADPSVGKSAAGSMSFTGTLTAANESFTDGIAGTGTGSIEGQAFGFDVSGNITGLNGEGAILYFNNTSGVDGGGTAFILD